MKKTLQSAEQGVLQRTVQSKVQRAADSAVQSRALTLPVLVNSQQLGVLAPSVNYRHSAGSRTTVGQIEVKIAGQSTGQSATWIAGDLKGRM